MTYSIARVALKKRSYNIIAGSGILKLSAGFIRKLDIGDAAYVITNARIKNKYGGQLREALKREGFAVRFRLVPDSEKSKSLETASIVIGDIARYDKKRRVFIVAFGGGVIGDLSGFVASIYKRGTPYIQIPTTLLAQVDSSIGGKTAVDLPEAKNLVGTFYQPRLVISDINTLKTLNLRQIRNGMAEVIKYAVIRGRAFFEYLERNYKDILALKNNPLEFIVKYCGNVKAGIVSRDEREERGARTVLNFGHTLGHAIEAAAGFKRYGHGEAVSLGMLLACDISGKLGLIGPVTRQRIERLIKKTGLPAKIKGLRLADIMEAYYRDKKFSGRKNKLVLLSGIGRTKIMETIPLGIIKEALKERMQD